MDLGLKYTDEDNAGGPPLDLDAAIREFYEEFPARAQDTFILNQSRHDTGRAAVASYQKKVADLLTLNPDAGVKMASGLAAMMFEGQLPSSVQISAPIFNGQKDTAIYGRYVMPAGMGFSARMLRSIFAANDFMPATAYPVLPAKLNDTDMWQRYVLEHELGHALTMQNIDKQAQKTVSLVNKNECAADAYAMIRHFQRYGADSAFPAYIRDIRNMNAVQKCDIDHWTVRALNTVIALNAKGRLMALTPDQSVDLALQIADAAALSADAQANMTREMLPIARMVMKGRKKGMTSAQEGHLVMETIAKVCDTGARTQSPAVLHTCKRFMVALKSLLPGDLPQDLPVDRLQVIARDNKAMASRTLKEEPAQKMTLGKIFSDALIDAQSGIKRPPQPVPQRKPKPPKP